MVHKILHIVHSIVLKEDHGYFVETIGGRLYYYGVGIPLFVLEKRTLNNRIIDTQMLIVERFEY